MGNSELRAELIRFCDSIRNYEHEAGHSIYQDERESSELVDIFLALPNYTMDQSEDDSHSPTEPTISDINDPANDDSILIEFQHLEFDTLQEGDWVEGTEEEYKQALRLKTPLMQLEDALKPIKMIRITDSEDDDALVYYEAKEVDKLIKSLLPAERLSLEKCHERACIDSMPDGYVPSMTDSKEIKKCFDQWFNETYGE